MNRTEVDIDMATRVDHNRDWPMEEEAHRRGCNEEVMQQSNSRLTVAAFAVCSQVQGETRWDQFDPASGSTESAPALAQTMPSVAGSPIPAAHASIVRGVALKGDQFFTAALQLGRPVNAGDMSLKWAPKGSEVEARVFVCGISAPASPRPFNTRRRGKLPRHPLCFSAIAL
jgi:hypothetical protein